MLAVSTANAAVDAERAAGNLLVLIRALEVKIDGLDRLIGTRIDSLTDALLAHEKLNEQTFAASSEAIKKAEQAQSAYNLAHNDLSRKMEAQYAMMMPRTEAIGLLQAHNEKFDEIKKEIVTLREFASTMGGKSTGLSAMYGYIIGALGFLVALVTMAIKFTVK